ncbi:MerR family DNA-binding transcriptional regulator [Ferrovibrio sp.]|uniref:MerR family transcriptional regulator n=1 Tax=Ferrovibrio sp. TaxID=1917215 RepID=UPI0025BC6BB8|nr:MerR family DNA-binding transcriptional regulator [Ferrovibrio sp.]MBX3453148.1 MerR family DNA-binding transcriptional regulator [Ferrovibrio sp.]
MSEQQSNSDQTFSITELSHEFKVTARAIRFYEDKGLLQPSRQGMNRIYSRRDRARLILILRGKRLGFSLAEIREMLNLYDLGDGQTEQLRVTLKRSQDRLRALETQRRDVEAAIDELHRSVRILEEYLGLKERGAKVPDIDDFVKGRSDALLSVAE